MKILVISYSLAAGGAEHFAVDLCNALAVHDEVSLLVTNSDASGVNRHYLSEIDPCVNYINLGCASGHSLLALVGIQRVIKKLKPDVVHANTDLLQLLIPLLICRKVKYVHTIHSAADYYLPSIILKPLYRFLYRFRVKAVTISEQCSQSFRNLYGLRNDTTIVNGCAKPICTSDQELVKKTINEYGGSNAHVFVHIARYARQKNQSVLFEAISKIHDAFLVVVGKDYPDSLIQSQDRSQVLFVGEKKNVADYLACADFFVLSSIMEGLPISLIEAMSMGVVPVSTPAGGVKDVIRNSENGFLSTGFDAESLADAMRRAISTTIDRNGIIAEYEQKYSMKNCALGYKSLFLQLVNS